MRRRGRSSHSQRSGRRSLSIRLLPAIRALENGHDRHRVTMAQAEILLQCGDDRTHLHTWSEPRSCGKAFGESPLAKLGRSFASLRLDVPEITLKAHAYSPEQKAHRK